MSVVASREHCRGSSGFTLIEVLVALLLIGLVLVPAMSAIASLLRSTARQDATAHASELARSTLEALRELPAGAFQEGTTITTVSVSDESTPLDVERIIRPYDEYDEGGAAGGTSVAVTLWEATVRVYKHPMSDNPTPLSSLTTLLFPQ